MSLETVDIASFVASLAVVFLLGALVAARLVGRSAYERGRKVGEIAGRMGRLTSMEVLRQVAVGKMTPDEAAEYLAKAPPVRLSEEFVRGSKD